MAKYCSNPRCGAEIDLNKMVQKKCDHKPVCDVCYEMFHAVNTSFFGRAQIEYQKQLRKIKRLMPGSNYLD